MTTRLVDTVSIQTLLDILQSRKIDPKPLISHRFKLDDVLAAYETFAHAGETRVAKVIIEP